MNINISLSHTTSAGAQLSVSANTTIAVSGSTFIKEVVTINTTDTVVSLGSVATIGFIMVKNLDPTNFFTFGSNGSSYPNMVNPGETVCTRWNGAAIHAKADTAACAADFTIISN